MDEKLPIGPHPNAVGGPKIVPPIEARPLAAELTDLAQRQPSVFQTLIQNFLSLPNEPLGLPAALTPEMIRKSLELDEKRSIRADRLRRQFLWAGVLVAVIVLGFVLCLVWLLREHVQFTEKVLATLTLLITHGAVGAGAYQAGKRGRRRKKVR